MKITRSDVLRAIAKEPLKPGAYVRSDGKDPGDCSVCAVGAVLRYKGLHNDRLQSAGDYVTQGKAVIDFAPGRSWHTTVETELEKKNYLGALSCFYEKIAPSRSRIRDRLRKWVQENLPTGVIYDGETEEDEDADY